MKGIIIYENDLGAINAVKLKHASFCYESIANDVTDTLKGMPVTCKSANCNKDDSYNFETGALIALMKMCGFDKSYKAIEEAFKYNSYDAKKSKELNIPKREFDKIHDLDVKEYYSKLSEENINLKKEKEQIIVAKNILYNNLEKENEKLKKRINELENYNAKLEERIAGEQRGGYKLLKDMEKLQHEYDLCKNSENALKCSVEYLNKTIAKLNTAIYGYKNDLNKVTKRCEELEIKESTLNKQLEQLDKREEKMSVYFGGRGCGKQYKALVELFKKLPQDKVDTAYKEAYNTKLPLWQKEVLNQMYGIYKESKEKTELPRTLDINGVKYRKMLQIKDFGEEISKLTVDSLIEQSRAFTRKCVDEWLCKPHTKREEMWEKIFANDKVVVKVKKEDINIFLKEIETRNDVIRWITNLKPTEALTNPVLNRNAHSKEHCYFYLESNCRLWYDTSLQDNHKDFIQIDYLPPMRWDLFKKGRLVVGVRNNNELVEFRKEVERNTGIKNIPMCPTNLCLFYSFDKDDYKIILETIGEPNSAKINEHKVYYWEDVR